MRVLNARSPASLIPGALKVRKTLLAASIWPVSTATVGDAAGHVAGSQRKSAADGVPARSAWNPILPLFAIAGRPRKLSQVVGPMPEVSPKSATVVIAPANGRRKMPGAAASIASLQSILVVAANATPKVLARAP